MGEENMVKVGLGLKAVRIDSITSFTAVAIFALTFMTLGTVVLGTNGLYQ